ncbi:hypothetical protein A1O1_07154 [Capronia coronata CBS 617.96]|uniref:Uncharacterized protein n=1 Tax=Capronia coronata CBS 617.96 TaxID=1182541 RepID=W9Y2S4_9EURO|nr:uncharacterized protein A1O1_07154 [Capronia coronata CBS 617.96]EXJ83531.1 hypothetical protein A1O1_07154 [Capronia coronata CBS 617.96]
MPHSVHPTPRTGTPDPDDLSIRYWNFGLPRDQWTKECPEYLIGIGQKNIGILLSKDEDCHRLSWQEVQELVRTNRIDKFQRRPSDLRAYLKHVYHLKSQYGSVAAYIQHELLRWDNPTPSGDPPFENPADYKILYNNWPYHIDQDITHLVVWTKFLIAEDETTRQVTAEAHASIETFIVRTFCSNEAEGEQRVNRNQIVWFQNWKSLKSVHALGRCRFPAGNEESMVAIIQFD